MQLVLLCQNYRKIAKDCDTGNKIKRGKEINN